MPPTSTHYFQKYVTIAQGMAVAQGLVDKISSPYRYTPTSTTNRPPKAQHCAPEVDDIKIA